MPKTSHPCSTSRQASELTPWCYRRQAFAGGDRARGFLAGVAMLTLLAGLHVAIAQEKPSAPAPASAIANRRIDALVRRLETDLRLEGVASATSWTLIHCAQEEELAKWRPFLEELGKAHQAHSKGDYSGFAALGGVDGIRAKSAEMLASGDQYVRGFAAILLAVYGDARDVPRAARLLTQPPPSKDGYDVGCAAMALGLLGAAEHKAAIAALLTDSRVQVASRSALGLGYLKAGQYAPQVAALLTKRFQAGEAQRAALGALGDMDARDQADQVALLLDKDKTQDVDTPGLAAVVLARLGATRYAPRIVPLLDGYCAESAALALAWMNATDQAPQLARRLKSSGPLARKGLALALGVMNARDHARDVAALLDDKEDYVRPYAAAALLLMDAKEYSPRVIAVLKDPGALAQVLHWHPLFAAESRHCLALARQRLAAWRGQKPASVPAARAIQ